MTKGLTIVVFGMLMLKIGVVELEVGLVVMEVREAGIGIFALSNKLS